MPYRSLGRTGVQVSSLCLGAMNFGGPTPEDESLRIIDAALDGGINFIDTADVYNAGESELIVGRALQRNGRRDEVVLATKVNGEMGPGPNDRGISRYHIIKACDDSLRRLQTDHIDLYQLHRPSLTIPQDETLRALDDLVRAGKVRYIGCSTFPAWMVMEALAMSERYGLALLPWSPLAGGILAGRYNDSNEAPRGSRLERNGRESPFGRRVTRRALNVARGVAEIAAERGLTPGQLALLWCKDQPGVTAPIVGPRTMEQLREALVVLDLELGADDAARLDALNAPGNAVSDFHNSNEWMKARVDDETLVPEAVAGRGK